MYRISKLSKQTNHNKIVKKMLRKNLRSQNVNFLCESYREPRLTGKHIKLMSLITFIFS